MERKSLVLEREEEEEGEEEERGSPMHSSSLPAHILGPQAMWLSWSQG